MLQGTTQRRLPVGARVRVYLRRHLIRGLIVVVPLGVTVYAINFCYGLTAGFLAPFIRQSTGTLPEAVIVGVSIVLFFGMLYLLGVIATAAAGRRIIALFEFVLRRIPLVKAVYGASKQIVDLLGPKDAENNYESAVLVDFPYPGVRSLAFVTGYVTIENGVRYARVFVPTTPNPTSGYLELYPPEMIHPCGLSVEDAVKAAMSAGILMPDTLDVSGEVDKDGAVRSGTERRSVQKEVQALSYWGRNKLIFRNRLISGMLLLIPLAVTVMVLRFIYGLTVGQVTPFTVRFFPELPGWGVSGISVVLLVAGLWTVGTVATAVLGQRLIALGEYLIDRIPMVSTIYGASKQIVATLAMQQDGAVSGLEAPVLVDFPYPGVRAVGFLVGRVTQSDGVEMCKIFMPTAPNISVGLFLMYRTEEVVLCGLSVEEAVRMVVSLGILCPKTLVPTPVAPVRQGA